MPWKWYSDAACTQELTTPLQFVHLADLSDNPQDTIVYYGEVEEDVGDNGVLVQQAYSNPGVDPIVVSIIDTAPSTGHPASEITLALSAAALATNTAGASLTISQNDATYGECLFSGVSNAVAVHVRVENTVTSPDDSTELELEWVETVDTEVTP